MLPLQAMIVIEPFGVDESCTAFTVFGDDLLSMRPLNLLAEVGKPCARTGEGYDVLR